MSRSLRQRALIIGPSNIGDAVLASDVVAAVHHRFSEAHLTLVVGARARRLFVEDPRVDTLVDADAFTSLGGRLKLALALWRYQPHIVVDLRHTAYPLLLAPLRVWRYLRQPPRTIRHMRERQLWKLRVQVPALAAASPQREGSSGLEPLWIGAKDAGQIDTLWRRWGLEGARRLVVICPGARSHIKRWAAEGFARVADRLIEEAGAQIVFSGEPEEESVVQEVLGCMRYRACSDVGLTTVRQLGELMRRAQLVITNDSASLHVASALRVPTVAIFGPTDEAKYGPTSARRRVIRRRLFCAPCERSLCRFNHECMRFISSGEVYEAARHLLDAGRRPHA